MFAASLGYGNMKIEGTGKISPDQTSMDIHFEIANVKKTQLSTPTSFGMKPAPLPIAVQPDAHATKPYSFKDKWYQTDKPSFGIETGKSCPFKWPPWSLFAIAKVEGTAAQAKKILSLATSRERIGKKRVLRYSQFKTLRAAYLHKV